MKRIHGFMMCLFALSATMFCAAALSQSMPATELRVALKGYDPVAYFTEQKPVKGNSAIRYDWDEARYYFASARNRDLFADDPERYAPRFAGYCTASITRGEKNEADPEFWAIVDGKLYLVGTGKGKEAAMKAVERLKNDPEMIALARKKWQELRK